MSTRFGMVRWPGALLLVVAVPALAQSSQAPTSVRPQSAESVSAVPEGSSAAESTEAASPTALAPIKPRKVFAGDVFRNIPVAGRYPVRLTVSGQARWREEFVRAFNVGPLNDDHGQSRLSLAVDLLAGDSKGWFGRLLVEARDAQSYGRTLPGGVRPTDADRHDMQNLYAEAGFGRSFVRVGRQEIALNRERLIGVPDWANTRRGSQGARLQLMHGPWAFEAIDVRPMLVQEWAANRPDTTARLRTLSVGSAPSVRDSRRGLPALWQVYRYDQQLRSSSASPLTHRHTSGGRLQWQWGHASNVNHARTLEFEGALQGGRVGTQVIDAWFWTGEGQWQWKRVPGRPSLALGVEEASGQSAGAAGRVEAFAVLYPAAHAHGGYADVIGRPNVRELHAIATWDPHRTVTLRGAAYRFDRLRRDDGIYTKQNTVFRSAGDTRARHAADEYDLTGTWKVTTHWRVIFGGALVVPGAFLRDAPEGARTERWSFVGTTFSF